MADSLVNDLAAKEGRLDPDTGLLYYSEEEVDYKATPREIVQSVLPSAADLSAPNKLQEYFDDCLENYGFCQLPKGTITGNLFIDTSSAILRGCGAPYSDRQTGTVIVPADPELPAITIREALHVQIESLGIQDADLGVSLEGGPTNLVFQTVLRDVGIADVTLGVRVSEPSGTREGQNAAADVTISHCTFTRNDVCVELNHSQALNVHLIDQCFLYTCGTGVKVNIGGRVLISGCSCNALGTWLRLLTAGGNYVPHVMRDIYSDRSGGAAAPIILDARGCSDRVRFLIDVFTSPHIAGDPPYNEVTHRFFYGPDGSADAIANSFIEIANPNMFIAPGNINPYG